MWQILLTSKNISNFLNIYIYDWISSKDNNALEYDIDDIAWKSKCWFG